MTGTIQSTRDTVVYLDDLAGVLTLISNLSGVSNVKSVAGLPGKVDQPDTSGFGDVADAHEVTGLQDNGPISMAGWHLPTASTKLHGKSARCLMDQYALSGYLTRASVKRSLGIGQSPAFGSSAIPRGVVHRQGGGISLGGYFDAIPSGIHTALNAQLSAQTRPVLSFAAGGFAVGKLVEMMRPAMNSYVVSSDSSSKDPVPVQAEFVADGRIDLGVSLHDLSVEVDLADGTTIDEAAATADGGFAHCHVTTLLGTSATVIVQHSVDGTTWATLCTFGALTAIGGYSVSYTGTVNRNVRYSISAKVALTSITLQVSAARRNYTTSGSFGAAGTHRHFVGAITRTAASGTQPASFTAKVGPEGNATGQLSLSCETRPSSYQLDIDGKGVTTWSMQLEVDGAITPGTF